MKARHIAFALGLLLSQPVGAQPRASSDHAWAAYWARCQEPGSYKGREASCTAEATRLVERICGRDGGNDATAEGPSCDRLARAVCGDRYERYILRDRLARPRRDDPVVRRYVREGMSLKDAKIKRSMRAIEDGC
jgi:hypothetical protein